MKKKSKKKAKVFFLSILAAALIILAYQFLLRPILKKYMATEFIGMGVVFILCAALVITVIMIFALALYLIVLKVQNIKIRSVWKKYIKNSIVIAIIIIFLLSGITYYSQKNAYVQPLCNEYNDVIPNSISSLEKVKIGDSEEWISMRGKDKNNPILLILSDGPGKSQMSEFNKSLKGLEENFVVVNWDEKGAGKSYKLSKELTMDDYVSDGVELTKYLCEKYNKKKIYLIGNSFGSALGILMVKKNPGLYEGFIGISQVVSVKKNEEYRYNKARELANSNDDESEIRKLKAQGQPPYEKKYYSKQNVYASYLRSKEKESKKIDESKDNVLGNIFSSEYGLIDKVNLVLGKGRSYNKVYNSYYNLELLERSKDINVPVYFFQGKYDNLSSQDILNEYYNSLTAPKKEIVTFEKSASKPWISENDKFVKEVNEKFLNK